eukprot:6376747-Amphidinium_carterae.1
MLSATPDEECDLSNSSDRITVCFAAFNSAWSASASLHKQMGKESHCTQLRGRRMAWQPEEALSQTAASTLSCLQSLLRLFYDICIVL